MTTLGRQIEGCRSNNLNAIRLLLALTVIFSHSFPVSFGPGGEAKGEPLFMLTRQQSFGSLAVNLFFFISGMFITASWLRSNSMQEFLMKRILRIYPGFIVAVVFSGALVCMFCPAFRSEIGNGLDWFKLMLEDWIFLTRHSLDRNGIFAENPMPGVANASLWTIPIEFHCYLLIAVIGLLCLFKNRMLVLLAALFSTFLYSKVLFAGENVNEVESRFLSYFLLGSSVWLWRDKIPFSKWIALGCAVTLLVSSQFNPWQTVIFPIIGGYCVLWLGYGPQTNRLAWIKKTDLSYGTYLYAFPIQQVLAMNASMRHPWINFLSATPITLSLAWLSWHLVEKRFIALKNQTRQDFDPGTGSNERVIKRSQ